MYEWDDTFETMGKFLECFKRKKYELNYKGLGYIIEGVFLVDLLLEKQFVVYMSTFGSLLGIGVNNQN